MGSRVHVFTLMIGVTSVGITVRNACSECGYDVTIVEGPSCAFGLHDTIWAFDLNDIGDLVGKYKCPVGLDDTAYHWDGAVINELEFPWEVSRSWAHGVNNNGEITGAMTIPDNDFGCLAFLATADEVINLGTLPGGNFSEANALNDQAAVVGIWGDSVTGDPTGKEAFLWTNGLMCGLGDDLGTPSSSASDINNLNQITGWMGSAVHIDAHAFLWHEGVVLDLGLLPNGMTSVGTGLSDRGHVVGSGLVKDPDTGDTAVRAFIWSGKEMVELPPCDGFNESIAMDVNAAGDAVGYCRGLPPSTAVIWRDGIVYELKDLVESTLQVKLRIAHGISEAGAIIVNGSLGPQDESVVILLSPVDQPITDLDGDCATGFGDLLMLLEQWQEAGSPADFDGDGVVTFGDLLILLASWTM